MVSQKEVFAGVIAALAASLSGCGTSVAVASGFPLNGIDGVSAEGTRVVQKTISWKNQEAKFEHEASSEWKFYTTAYSCFMQPSGCSFKSRTEEKNSTVLHAFESGALTVTKNTNGKCVVFKPEPLSPALPKRNTTAACLGDKAATCDVWRQYTAYKPKSNGQSWTKYTTEMLYYFKQGDSKLDAQKETQIVTSSNKTTTIEATLTVEKWEIGDVGDDKFTADKGWSCDEKTALGAGVLSV